MPCRVINSLAPEGLQNYDNNFIGSHTLYGISIQLYEIALNNLKTHPLVFMVIVEGLVSSQKYLIDNLASP